MNKLVSRIYRLLTGEPAVIKTTGAGTLSDPAIPHVIVEAESVEWANVRNKPLAFPPEEHTHPIQNGFLGTKAVIYAESRPLTRPDGNSLVAGDFWINTNTGEQWYRTTGYWVSSYLHSFQNDGVPTNPTVSLSGTAIIPVATLPIGAATDILLVSSALQINQGDPATTDTNNNFTIDLLLRPGSLHGVSFTIPDSNILDCFSDGVIPGSGNRITRSLNQFIQITNYSALMFNVIKTGTIGNCSVNFSITYRHAIPD